MSTPARARRGGGDRRLRPQPQGPAAGGAGRVARDHGARSRHPHRRQGRGGRRHRQGAGHRHDLSASSRATTWDGAQADAGARWSRQHGVELIAIGNGTATRETDKLVADLHRACCPELKPTKVMVSRGRRVGLLGLRARRAGASRISTSPCAARCRSRGACRTRWPNWSRSIRKSIGVGQYQHDVDQTELARSLDAVVEDCVNAVGVDRQHRLGAAAGARVRASAPALAANIVAYRDANGAVPTRAGRSKKVPRLGPKAFEQARASCASRTATNPLDASARASGSLSGGAAHRRAPADATSAGADRQRARSCARSSRSDFVDDTLRPADGDRHPARAGKARPRSAPEFKTATFPDGVEKINDLKPGMMLEGTVTNVAASAPSSTSACTRTAWCTSRRLSDTLRQGPARGGEGRRHRQGEGAGGRRRRASASR